MNKVLIEVTLPAAGLSYDIFVPDSMQIGTLTMLTASVFSRLSGGVYTVGEQAVLCSRKTGEQYDINARLFETDIRNGTKLLLY